MCSHDSTITVDNDDMVVVVIMTISIWILKKIDFITHLPQFARWRYDEWGQRVLIDVLH